LDADSDHLSCLLKDVGIDTHEVVSFLMTDRLGIITLLFALGKIGAAWTPLNPRSTALDWMRQIQHCQSRTVIYDYHEVGDARLLKQTQLQVARWICLNDMDRSPKRAAMTLTPPFSWDQLAGLLYTSGTTGAPKGVRHTHKTLWGWNYSLLQSLGLSWRDRVLNPYPLFHMGGIGFTLAAIQAGATAVLETPFQPDHFLQSVQRFHPTVTFMVPTMVQALLELPESVHSSLNHASLRRVITTSAPLLATTRRDMERAWPTMQISVLYSATEAVYSLLSHEDGAAALCVGRPVFGVSLRILDDQYHDCPHGVIGTIYGRGLSVFSGYHAPDSHGNKAWHGEWFTCHDVGYLDDQGYLYLIDRAKDLINSGGEKISSLEIENALQAHPDVREAAVIGVADPYWGERIHAAVVRANDTLTAQQLHLFLAQRLPRYKLPRSLEFVAELPKGETGKILKQALRPAVSVSDLTTPPLRP
jgi:acyl-CoA synthetase (AMP-forming)/AMP-acid ligase II